MKHSLPYRQTGRSVCHNQKRAESHNLRNIPPDRVPMFDLNAISQQTSLRHIEFHESLDSTNRLAIDLLKDLLELSPSLVLTNEQTAGRGRGSNSWWASAGALTFSLVVDFADCNVAAEHRSFVSLAMGLAVRSVVAQRVPQRSVNIKWPNDVLVDDRKVCGILVEQHSVENQTAIIVGVGCNVNNSLTNAPVEVQQRATSMFDISGDSLSMDEVLIEIINAFDKQCGRIAATPDELIADINRHNVLTNRNVTLNTETAQHTGRCLGVNDNGALLLQCLEGPKSFLSGSIESWE